MSLVIWKYAIFTAPITNHSMPRSAKVLCVQVQMDQPCIWVLLDPQEQQSFRRFHVVPTGLPMESIGKYIGTFQLNNGNFVGHLFEESFT